MHFQIFVWCFVLLFSFMSTALTGASTPQDLPDCEWCGATEAPKELSWDIRIASIDEPGEPMIISGRAFKADRKTPAAGVIFYLYHTNAEGLYAKKGNESGNGVRHGYLRGWLRTDKAGRYRFTTIKPAPYPNRSEPSHVHITVLEPGKKEYWLDSFHFKGDPLITDRIRKRFRNMGGSGVIQLKKNKNGIWIGERIIILPK